MRLVKISTLCHELDTSPYKVNRLIASDVLKDGIHFQHTVFGRRFNISEIKKITIEEFELETLLKDMLQC